MAGNKLMDESPNSYLSNMKILLLSEEFDVYTIQLWKYLKKYDPEVRISLLTNRRGAVRYRELLTPEADEEIYVGGESVFSSIPGYYVLIKRLPRFDIIQVLWMEIHWGALASSLKHRTRDIYISVGGSDLYRKSRKKWIAYLQKRLIRRSSVISSENSYTRDYFYATYGEWTRDIPHHIVRYGVDVIDELAASDDWDEDALYTKWDIPVDKHIIMLGHNGSEAHQHLEMISAVGRMTTETLKRCFFLIPMTYSTPGADYREAVEAAISRITPDYKVLDVFMNTTEMAEITMLTDIMIHMQTTDQLSSTMMAHLYAGNVVLAGSWLPYSDIKEKAIKLFDVEDFDSLTDVLSDVVCNIDAYKAQCSENREKVYEFSSWEYCIKGWMGVYKYLVEKGSSNG